MNFFSILNHAHSGWRWIVLLTLLYCVIRAGSSMSTHRRFTAGDRRMNLFAVIAVHLQALVGFVLYFMSPNVQFGESMMSTTTLRFFTIEHSVIMLLAVVLITIGNSRSKKRDTDSARFKVIFWFFLFGLLLILAGIPWPFRGLGAGWF